ncbi:MAG: hypothetical protein ACOC1F_06570 [Myxococcota bacterium]
MLAKLAMVAIGLLLTGCRSDDKGTSEAPPAQPTAQPSAAVSFSVGGAEIL